jgi:hypothetical protein
MTTSTLPFVKLTHRLEKSAVSQGRSLYVQFTEPFSHRIFLSGAPITASTSSGVIPA